MKTTISFLLSLCFLFTNAQTTYYFDDEIGQSTNDGTSKAFPLKSIADANKLLLMPGDSILFRRGGKWNGNLKPKGSGSNNNRIVIGAYGNGPLPELNANGVIHKNEKASYTIQLYNQEYIEIRDLKIRNYNNFEKPRKFKLRESFTFVNAPKMAIYIQGQDYGTLHEIYLINLEICDVNGDMSTKHNGGVFSEITWNKDVSKRIKSNFEDLYTEGCYFHDLDRTSWSNTSVWSRRSLTSIWDEKLANGRIHNWYPSHKIVLRNNRFERAGANALIVRVAESPLVEYCVFTENGIKGSGNASFPFNCDNALFQYNEASYTYYNTEATSWNHRPDVDAGGFDSDWNCKNTVIQYNYSHHNGHGGILLCSDGNSKTSFNDGTIIRYNIFESNKHHIIRCSGNITNSAIYNNVLFAGEENDSVMLVYSKSWGGYADGTTFMNNIFYSKGSGNYFDMGESTSNLFKSNTFYGSILNEPNDEAKSTENPLFLNDQASPISWRPSMRFILQNHSPAINGGIMIDSHPMKDYLGRPIIGKPDRGAFEHNK